MVESRRSYVGPVRRLAVLAVAAALLAACGSDGAGDDETATGETVPVELRDFCDAFGAVVAGPLFDGATDLRDPLVMEGVVQQVRADLGSAVESAPDDLADPMAEVAAVYGAVFDLWERYGFDLVRLEAEGTPEELATMDEAFAPPQGPGAADAFTVVEDGYFGRCTAGVTLPPGVLDELTTTATTSP